MSDLPGLHALKGQTCHFFPHCRCCCPYLLQFRLGFRNDLWRQPLLPLG